LLELEPPVPTFELLTLAVPPLPPLPPLPVIALMPPLACGDDDEMDRPLPLPASVAVGSDVELEVPLAPPLLFEFWVDDTELLPDAPPVPPPVVLPVLLPLFPVVEPVLPDVGLAVDELELPPVVLDEDGDAVDDEVDAPVFCAEPAPVALEVELPEAVPPAAAAPLVFEPLPPLPATFASATRLSAVLHCSSSFVVSPTLLPLFVALAPLVPVVLPWVTDGLPLLLVVVLPPLLVVVFVVEFELNEPLLFDPLVLLFVLLPLFPLESAAATLARLSVRAAAASAAMSFRCLNFPPYEIDRYYLLT
jgi:hypothetical protein